MSAKFASARVCNLVHKTCSIVVVGRVCIFIHAEVVVGEDLQLHRYKSYIVRLFIVDLIRECRHIMQVCEEGDMVFPKTPTPIVSQGNKT